jgi:hypothetical protein
VVERFLTLIISLLFQQATMRALRLPPLIVRTSLARAVREARTASDKSGFI